MKKFFLLKTEPETYSIAELKRDQRTEWNGVRNFQARNVLQTVSAGDLAVIYHSGGERAVVGVGVFSSGPIPDPDPKRKGDWVKCELKFQCILSEPFPLAEIKVNSALRALPLLKQSRLSCMEISEKEFLILTRKST